MYCVVALAMVTGGSALWLDNHHGDDTGIPALRETLEIPGNTISDFSFDASTLQKIAAQHKASYAAAEPFPHIVLDSIVPDEVVKAVSNEYPEESPDVHGCFSWATTCFSRNRQQNARNTRGEFLKCDVYDNSSFMDPGLENGKNMVSHFEDMRPATKILTKAFQSDAWVKFLSELTGIKDLAADPGNRGAGLHAIAEEGFLHVHADFNMLDTIKGKMRRRVNLLFFMNEDWKDEYGGHLELWNRNLTSCDKRILPSFNRLVIFSTTDFSYHGHPNPLTAPKGRVRRSIAQYFYNWEFPKEDCLQNNCSFYHTTLFQDLPCVCPLKDVDIIPEKTYAHSKVSGECPRDSV